MPLSMTPSGVRRDWSSSGTSSAPGVDWTQCVGQRRMSYLRDGFSGCAIVVLDS